MTCFEGKTRGSKTWNCGIIEGIPLLSIMKNLFFGIIQKIFCKDIRTKIWIKQLIYLTNLVQTY